MTGVEGTPQGGYTIVEIAARDLPPPHTQDGCKRGCKTGYLSRYIKTSGATAIRWVCDQCESYDIAGDLPRYLSGDTPLKDLPIRANFEDDGSPECSVCGVPGVEFHHWAPRSLFPDWPDVGAYLCPRHHTEWHDTMHKYGLRWPSELVDAT